jgi:glycosyltransferase involved in cell wall biosynthesis
MKRETQYFDVTQLVHWSGRITGIPRVMEELAIRYQRAYPDTVFVAWVKEIREFCELDLNATLAQRGHGIVYLRSNEESTTPPDTDELRVQEVKAPTPSLAKRAVKKSLRVTARYNPRVARAVEQRAQRVRMSQWRRAGIGKGDSLFIPWGEWWDGNFITKLEQLHESGTYLLQVLHDMSPIVVPQFSNSGNATKTFPVYCRRILPICDLVLSVSENSRQDALRWLKANTLPVPKIEVFRLGDDIEIAKSVKPDDAHVKGGLKDGFLLMVGTIELKKNHQLLYYTYKLAKSRGIDLPPIVLAGRYGWMTEATVELMQKDPEVKDKLIFMIGPSDEELSWLYDHCLFTVLPSLYEGWGIPIAESVARGVPCLCSDTSSMTEIAEGYVKHFNPTSTDECLAGIQAWLQPDTLAAARKKVKNYKQYSWDDSFAQVDGYVKETIHG